MRRTSQAVLWQEPQRSTDWAGERRAGLRMARSQDVSEVVVWDEVEAMGRGVVWLAVLGVVWVAVWGVVWVPARWAWMARRWAAPGPWQASQPTPGTMLAVSMGVAEDMVVVWQAKQVRASKGSTGRARAMSMEVGGPWRRPGVAARPLVAEKKLKRVSRKLSPACQR